MKQLERPDLAYYFDDTTEVAKTLNEITFNAGGQCLIDIIYEDDKLWLAAGSRVEVFGLNFFAETQEEIAPINVGSNETYFVYVSDTGALSMSTQEPFWNNYACGYYYNELRAIGKVQVVSGAIRFFELPSRASLTAENYIQLPMASRLLILESSTPGSGSVNIDVKGVYEITLIGGGGQGEAWKYGGGNGGNNGGLYGAYKESGYNASGGGGGGGSRTSLTLELDIGNYSYVVGNGGGSGGGKSGGDTKFDGMMGALVQKGGNGGDAPRWDVGGNGADGFIVADKLAGDGELGGGVGGIGYGAGGGGTRDYTSPGKGAPGYIKIERTHIT